MPTPPPAYDEAGRGLGLASLLEIVRRRRVLALLPFLFVVTAAAGFAVFLPSLWTATALVLVDRQQIPETYVKSTVASDLEARLLTLSHAIFTGPRLRRIVDDHDLYPALRHRVGPDELADRMRRDIRLDVLDERERRREERAIAFTVAYTATDPVTAARVTNALADLYTEENSRLQQQQATGASDFLEAQLEELRQKLVGQERRITEYKERHLGELPEQRDVNLRTLERLQQQLQLAHEVSRRAAERRRLITQSLGELDLTSGLAAGGLAGPSVTPGETAAARLNLLRNELAALQTQFSDKYPDVIQMKEQIRILEGRVADEQKKLATAAASPKPATTPPTSRQTRDPGLAVHNP
ncbi:MAG TPA: hypothetical protein VFX28_14525, partial [Methylomirabilota bacterium]|nr:hypothetical protein [Methylomirabilota bacterium]